VDRGARKRKLERTRRPIIAADVARFGDETAISRLDMGLPRAHELTLAQLWDLTAEEVRNVHAHPTLSETLKEVAHGISGHMINLCRRR
jgi:hypothetical protein